MLWTLLGMEYDGVYTLDHAGADGLEKVWYCLNVNPSREVVIVRLGRDGDDTKFWLDMFAYLAERLK